MKHTPSPWSVDTDDTRDDKLMVIGHVGQPIADVFVMDRQGECEANAERIVACVNAMEGIKDPKKLRETWDAIQHLELDAYFKTKQKLDARTKRLDDALEEIGQLKNQLQLRQDDRPLKSESWKVTSGDVTEVVLAGSHLEAIVVFERIHGLYETTSVQLLAK